MTRSIYDFTVETINGEQIKLDHYQGKALLIVNTASRCGFTPQYAELEEVYQKYKDKDFEVLAFPCNQFGKQEPGTNQDIAEFCALNFKTSFPLFAKVNVNGEQAHPLFQYLREELPGVMGSRSIKWNFTKFFIDKSGKTIKRFAPQDKPNEIMKEMASYL